MRPIFRSPSSAVKRLGPRPLVGWKVSGIRAAGFSRIGDYLREEQIIQQEVGRWLRGEIRVQMTVPRRFIFARLRTFPLGRHKVSFALGFNRRTARREAQ